MSIFSVLKRFGLLLLEAFICGPSYAKYLFWARCSNKVLDAQIVWDRFTKPNNPFFEWLFSNYPPGIVRQLLCDFYATAQNRIRGLSSHYDLSNDFYKLFLDKSYMFYSCADFLNSTDTLENAQENKANYILDLIDPQPGEKILDLGCGWGGMMKRVYEKTGDKANLLGYNLSIEQIKFIAEEYGLNAEYKDFVTAEYEPKSFDKIYSIGSYEHIPKSELLSMAKKLAMAIKPTGRIVHHFFCQLSEWPPTRLLAGGARVFPGIELASFKQHLETFEQAGLKVVHHSLHDYRPTLKAWFYRLAANKDKAIQLVGIETYNMFQCYLAEAWRLFDDRDLILTRYLLQRQDAPVRWTTSTVTNLSQQAPRPPIASYTTSHPSTHP